MRQAYDVRATTQDETEEGQGEVIFSTIVKLANAQKETVLLDGIEVSSLKKEDIEFEPSGVELRVLESQAVIHLPPHTAPGRLLDYLPLLIKSDEERIIAMGFRFQYSPRDDADAAFKLSEHIEQQGLRVAFRINDKFRNYVMTVKRPE